MFIYNPDEVNQVWKVFEMFDAAPEIDEKTKNKINGRLDDIFQNYGDLQYENGIQNCNHGEDYYS